MTVLVQTRARDVRSLLPAGRDLQGWHAALSAEISSHLSPAHAAVLARPVPGADASAPDTTAWEAPGGDVRAFAELPAADRRALTDALGVIISRIRRLAESGAAPAVAACWPALREIPDLRMVFAVDGAPVIAAWGHASATAGGSAGLLARYDDGVTWRPPVHAPRLPYATTLAALLLLALLAGLTVPLARARLFGTLAQCPIDPASQSAMDDALREQSRNARLRGDLAALEQERGQRRLLCPPTPAQTPMPAPLPAPVPAPAPAPPAPVAPAPPVHAALPEQQWNQHDLSMLEGCWNRFSNMQTRDPATGQVFGVKTWNICFDRNGQGRQTVTWSDGEQCENPMQAQFTPDNDIEMRELNRCTSDQPDGRGLVRSRALCHRTSDSEANCLRTELEGPQVGHAVPGAFRR